MFLHTAASLSWAGTIVFLLASALAAVYVAQGAKERKRAAAAAAYNARMRAAAEERRAAAEKAEKERAAAQRKQQRAERAAARERAAEERAARQAAKLAAARELAELKERALQAEKELRALKAAPVRAAKRAETISNAAPVPAPRESFQTFPVACQLAKKYADNVQTLAGKSFTVTEKLDGVRCLARVDRADVQLFARSGKRIEGLAEIENALALLNISAVLDGELLIAGHGALPSKEEYKRTCSIVASKGEKSGIVFHVFDMVPLDTYTARAISAPYSARRAALERLETISPMEVVPVLYSGTDAAQIEKQLQKQREARHEGVMINLDDAPYAYTRTASLLKYKIMQDCDLQIVGVNPGTGKNAGSLGSITVAYKGGTVKVGAGIPDALRRAIWADPAAYIGRVVSVQYFEETQDRTGKKSLRFPAFKELRELGKEVSYA